jgi:antitoxin component of MazEF toxin-antitoxin module
MSTTRRRVALRAGLTTVVTAAVLTGSFLAGTSAAAADQPTRASTGNAPGPVASAMLKSGEKLTSGQKIKSGNGKFTLRMQRDGNLVLLNDTGEVKWHAGTAPNRGAVTTMQRDGNLTIVSAENKPLWHTGTQGTGVNLHVQNDGNLTVRLPDGTVLWALSDEIAGKAQLRPGQALRAGEERHSLDGKITLRMQEDGNLVLLNDAGKVLWHAGTAPNPGAKATMQRDGNLTVVSAANKPLWHTATQGSEVTTHIQNDGNLTVRTRDGKVLWASR